MSDTFNVLWCSPFEKKLNFRASDSTLINIILLYQFLIIRLIQLFSKELRKECGSKGK